MTATGPMSVSVASRIEDLVRAAKAETGLDDLGADSWRQGLEVLIASALAEASFNDAGEQSFYGSIVKTLANRLRVEDWYARHPEIDDQEVELELLGVGLPRTGSTALEHMLAEDRGFRSLRIWEASAPCPPPGVSPEDDVARVESTRAMLAMQDQLDARIRSMLPRSATGPIEDHDLMGMEFKAQNYLAVAHLPSYAEWFLDCEMESTYRYERRVLALLQWMTPAKRWRLKSPTHTLFLEAFESVFPEARFVQTHREVGTVLASVSDLYFTMLSGQNTDVDPAYVGELNMAQWGVALDRVLEFRRDPARDAKFFDIGFTTFQTDPIAEIRRLYDWLGDELTDDAVASMVAWREANPKDKYGRHEYDGSQFGITGSAIDARFRPYRDRFGALL